MYQYPHMLYSWLFRMHLLTSSKVSDDRFCLLFLTRHFSASTLIWVTHLTYVKSIQRFVEIRSMNFRLSTDLACGTFKNHHQMDPGHLIALHLRWNLGSGFEEGLLMCSLKLEPVQPRTPQNRCCYPENVLALEIKDSEQFSGHTINDPTV